MSLLTASIAFLAWMLLLAEPALGQTKLLRFPAIRGDRIAFSYGGDLWTASASGGGATRVTTHPGVELFAKFCPDGRRVLPTR